MDTITTCLIPKDLSLLLDYSFHLCSVFESKVSLACEAEVDKLFSVLYKSTQI